MTEDGEYETGDWWEPIRSAPREGQRLLLSFPPFQRTREKGEKGGGGDRSTYIRAARSAFGWWIPPEKADWNLSPDGDGYWSPDWKGRKMFDAKPTHWMNEPEVPEEYSAAA